MYYANNGEGKRVYIDDANREEKYFCPFCNSSMIMKCGKLVCHHFAHAAKQTCDPWYKGNGKSKWHRNMQAMFPPEKQEVIVWNEDHSIFHIADVVIENSENENNYVYEFQHSTISPDAFIERSQYYLDLGYSLVWIFDYCTVDSPKIVFRDETYQGEYFDKYIWPGRDRIRTLESKEVREFFYETNCNSKGKLFVFFYVRTGPGESKLITYTDERPYSKWEFKNPFRLEEKYLKPYFLRSDDLTEFYATTWDKQEFEKFIVQK